MRRGSSISSIAQGLSPARRVVVRTAATAVCHTDLSIYVGSTRE